MSRTPDHCGLCSTPTRMAGTKRCDRCWELEGRIQRDPELARRILSACTPSEMASEVTLLRRACDAAFAFIDSHIADPDLTEEMVRKHADYREARDALEAHK